MEQPTSSQRLQHVVATVLEDSAFVFTTPGDPDRPWGAPIIETVLDFRGPPSGRMVMTSSKGFGATLVANLLDVEPDDPNVDRQAEEALCETLNVLAGHVLSECLEGGAGCTIGIPRSRRIDPTVTAAGDTSLSISLCTDEDERIDLRVERTGS